MQGISNAFEWLEYPDLAKDRTSTVRQKLARRLYNARMRSRVSQTELARRARLTQAQIWDFENAKTSVKVDYLLRIAAALGVSPSSLIEGINSNG